MSESPNSADAQRIVDDLEGDIVDVDKAAGEQQAGPDEGGDEGGDAGGAEDVTDAVPGAPEPTD